MTSVPSVTARSESSGPSRRSSTTIFLPLRPKRSSTSMASIAFSASCSLSQTTTPLPRARPSAFTATFPSLSRAQALAGAGCVKASKSAVGMLARRISSLANDLLDSMRPAPRLGPKTLNPACRRASPTPASTAASGPRTMRPSRSCRAKSTRRTTSAAPILMLRAMPPDPPTRTFSGALFPLDGARRLRRDVEHHPVDALDLVDDPVRDPRQHLVRHARPVRGHGVLARHHTNCDDVRVRPVVPHHTDGLQRCQHRERLPHLPVQTVALDLVDDDPVGVAQDLQPLGRDLAEAADRQARTGERLPVHHLLRHPQLEADRAHLVLEEIAQWLDELEAQAR